MVFNWSLSVWACKTCGSSAGRRRLKDAGRVTVSVGRLLGQLLLSAAVWGFGVRLLVLDEDLSHELLRAWQRNAGLELKHSRMSQEDARWLITEDQCSRDRDTYRIFLQSLSQKSIPEYRSTIFCHFGLLFGAAIQQKHMKQPLLHEQRVTHQRFVTFAASTTLNERIASETKMKSADHFHHFFADLGEKSAEYI